MAYTQGFIVPVSTAEDRNPVKSTNPRGQAQTDAPLQIQCDFDSGDTRCDWCDHQGLACTFNRVRGRKKAGAKRCGIHWLSSTAPASSLTTSTASRVTHLQKHRLVKTLSKLLSRNMNSNRSSIQTWTLHPGTCHSHATRLTWLPDNPDHIKPQLHTLTSTTMDVTSVT